MVVGCCWESGYMMLYCYIYIYTYLMLHDRNMFQISPGSGSGECLGREILPTWWRNGHAYVMDVNIVS